LASREKNSESSRIPPKSAIEQAARDLAGVLEHGDDDAQRGRREDDRHQQRLASEPEAPEREPGGDRDSQRHREPGGGEPQPAASQAVHVDLQPGQEQQEREPDRGKHLHRRVDLHPAEPRGPDDDPRHDLQHHRGQPQARRQAERRDDHQQVPVSQRLHARPSAGHAIPLRGPGCARRP